MEQSGHIIDIPVGDTVARHSSRALGALGSNSLLHCEQFLGMLLSTRSMTRMDFLAALRLASSCFLATRFIDDDM